MAMFIIIVWGKFLTKKSIRAGKAINALDRIPWCRCRCRGGCGSWSLDWSRLVTPIGFSGVTLSSLCLDFPDLLFLYFSPRTLGVFFGAALACCQVLDTVHLQATAAVTRRHNTLAPFQLFHPGYHVHLVRT